MLSTNEGLRLNLVSMQYKGSSNPLIVDLSLGVEFREVLTILGPSGVGKSTLLRIIAGLERNYTGEVNLNGDRIKGPGRRIQIMFQDYRLLPWLTAAENVAFALGSDTNDARRKLETAEEFLSRVGLAERVGAWPRDLSGGERARVAMARAMAGRPSVLLMDEPFSNVDVALKKSLRQSLVEFARTHDAIVLMVTHNIQDALDVSDKIYVFAARPMHEYHSITLSDRHPRDLGSPSLRAIGVELMSTLMSGESKEC